LTKGRALADVATDDDDSVWIEFRKYATSVDQFKGRLKQLSARNIKPFISFNGDAEHDSLVYCGGSGGSPSITSMQALYTSVHPENWLQYLHYKHKHPATRKALQAVAKQYWPGKDVKDKMQLLKDTARAQCLGTLKTYAEMHQSLRDRIDETWSHADVVQLGEGEGLNQYSVPLYQTDVTAVSGRGIFGVLPLFVGLGDDNEPMIHEQKEMPTYEINSIYKTLIKKEPTSFLKKKGKGKRKASAAVSKQSSKATSSSTSK
jgi:hypothetical protein